MTQNQAEFSWPEALFRHACRGAICEQPRISSVVSPAAFIDGCVIDMKGLAASGCEKNSFALPYIWYTIIQSARRNLVDVLPYLTDVLTRLPSIVPEYLSADPAATPFSSLAADQIAALRSLLPDLWLREHPEHLLTERAQELAAATARRRHRRAKRRVAVRT